MDTTIITLLSALTVVNIIDIFFAKRLNKELKQLNKELEDKINRRIKKSQSPE